MNDDKPKRKQVRFDPESVIQPVIPIYHADEKNIVLKFRLGEHVYSLIHIEANQKLVVHKKEAEMLGLTVEIVE